MRLKTATLYAIIGQIIGILPYLLFKFIKLNSGSYQVANWIYFIAQLISVGTMILFLTILYKNQK